MFKISNKYLLQIICGLVFTSLCTWSYAALDQWVIASGGNYTTSDNISLGHTIGQPFVPAQNSQFIAGFWHGAQEELLPVTLAFSDIPDVISTCENFEITVQVQAPEDQEVDTVAAFLNFQSSVLKVIKVKGGLTLDQELMNKVDSGHIDFIAGSSSPVKPKGNFDLMTITFKALKPITQTGLSFNLTEPRKTDVLRKAKTVFSGEPVSIGFPISNAGSLSGKVPNFKNHPLRVHVSPPQPEKLYEVMTDANGRFSLTGEFEVGSTYDVYVSWTNTLVNKKAVSIPAGCQTDFVNFEQLVVGDLIGIGLTRPNNHIYIEDFSALSTFHEEGQFVDDVDFNLDGVADLNDHEPKFIKMHFDLNNDGTVNDEDNTLFGQNFSKKSQYNVGPYLKKGNRGSTRAKGEELNVTVKVNTHSQLIDAVAANLHFDPTLLQVNQITAGNHLDTLLQSQFDNNKGQVSFVAGQWSKDKPSGIFPIMTVSFTQLGSGGEQTLTTEVEAVYRASSLPEVTAEISLDTNPAVTATLTVTKQGSGTVTSDVGGIDCGVTCQADYPPGTTVMLTATPATDFNKWVGNCQGTTNPLIVNMDADKNCTAVFGTDLLVTLGDFSITPTANNTLLITWQTLSETDTLAFYLWRAQPTSEGLCADYLNTTDITRLTTDPIEAQGSLESGTIYTYEIPNNLTDYCYGLEEIDSQGNRTFYIIGPGIDGWLPIFH